MKILNCKSMLIFAILLSYTSSYAKKKTPEPQAAPSQIESKASQELANTSANDELKTLFDTISNEMVSIEEMLNRKDWGAAITAAKSILDRSSAIMPKTKVAERFPIKNVLFPRDLILSFNQLRFNQQQAIAAALGNARGGYYMDLLNLYKRARVLYSWAYYNQFKTTLIKKDLESLKTKLVTAVNIPLYVQDEGWDEPFLVFDTDVAGTDQAELFNREVYTVLLGIKELELTENEIEKLIFANKTEVLRNHIQSLRVPKTYQEFRNMPEYDSCYQRLRYDYYEGTTINRCDAHLYKLFQKQ